MIYEDMYDPIYHALRISDKNDVLTLRVNYDKINQLEQNQKSVYMRRKRCRKLQALYRKRNHTDSIII